MPRLISHALGCDRGASTVEFTLVLPLFVALVFGLIEFGRAAWMYTTLNHAVQEAARFAIVHGADSASPADATAIETVMRDNATGMPQADITVTVTFVPDNQPGSTVTVAADYTMSTILEFGSFGFSADSTVIISQ